MTYFYRDERKSPLNLLMNRYKPESGWRSSLQGTDMLRIPITPSADYSFVLVLSFEMFARDRRQ